MDFLEITAASPSQAMPNQRRIHGHQKGFHDRGHEEASLLPLLKEIIRWGNFLRHLASDGSRYDIWFTAMIAISAYY